MPQHPMEKSPFLAPDLEQPSTPISATPLMTEAAEPTNDPPASAVASESSPRPRSILKMFFTRRNPVLLGFVGLSLVAGFVAVAIVSTPDGPPAYLPPSNEDGVTIFGKVTRFDWLDTHLLSVTWFVAGRGEYAATGISDQCLPINTAVDVYLNDPSNPAFSYDPTKLPRITTGEGFCPEILTSFNTEHKISTNGQYRAPLDLYLFTAFAFVVKRVTNESIPITGFAFDDSGPADFTAASYATETTRNNFTYDTDNGPNTMEVESSTMFAAIKHSKRARALTLSMFAINWVLTLCSVAIALVVYRRRGEVKDGVALLPITVILTIPTIRGLYVGSPPFGIDFDIWGFFPQMLIVLVCAMVVLLVFAMQPTRERGIALEKKEV